MIGVHILCCYSKSECTISQLFPPLLDRRSANGAILFCACFVLFLSHSLFPRFVNRHSLNFSSRRGFSRKEALLYQFYKRGHFYETGMAALLFRLKLCRHFLINQVRTGSSCVGAMLRSLTASSVVTGSRRNSRSDKRTTMVGGASVAVDPPTLLIFNARCSAKSEAVCRCAGGFSTLSNITN